MVCSADVLSALKVVILKVGSEKFPDSLNYHDIVISLCLFVFHKGPQSSVSNIEYFKSNIVLRLSSNLTSVIFAPLGQASF